MINAILISYGCVFKASSKTFMKGSSVKTIEEARNEYKKLLEEKNFYIQFFLKNCE